MHGQASVERGFSVNTEIMLENMVEHTLKAQQTISDHIKSVGGALNVQRNSYYLPLCQGKGILHIWMRFKIRRKVKKGEKRKMCYDEVEELKSKKKTIQHNRDALVKSADEFADKAESSSKLEYISKSNVLRCAEIRRFRQLVNR